MRHQQFHVAFHCRSRQTTGRNTAINARAGASTGPVVVSCVVLIALVVGGWMLLRSRSRAQEEAASKQLEAVGAILSKQNDRVFSANLTLLKDAESVNQAAEALSGLPELSVLDASRTVFGDEHAKAVGQLTNLTSLMLNNTKLTDDGLSQLEGLTSLSTLGVANTEITAKGLQALQSMDELTVLDLSGTKVTGGLETLAQLPKLDWLNMRGVTISDDSLIALVGSESLGKLTVDSRTISSDAVDALKEKNPDLNVDVVDFANTPAAGAPVDEQPSTSGTDQEPADSADGP